MESEKKDIERAIERARDGVGDHIDELDRRLRSSLDLGAHAPQLVAGGAVVGFLAGFGFPKALRRAISIGIPLALIAMQVRKRIAADGNRGVPDYQI